MVVISAVGTNLIRDTSRDTSLGMIRATVDRVRRTILEMYDDRADGRTVLP